jgi:hypothetical protein
MLEVLLQVIAITLFVFHLCSEIHSTTEKLSWFSRLQPIRGFSFDCTAIGLGGSGIDMTSAMAYYNAVP